MSPTRVSAILVALCLGLMTIAGAARASVASDCDHHNALTQHYTATELQRALATLPADVREYTACAQIIQNQLFKQLGTRSPKTGPGTRSSSGGSFISTPLLIVLILIVLGGGGLAYLSVRRRPPGGGGDAVPPPP